MLHSLQRALDTVVRTAASDPIGQSRIARGRCGLAAHGSRIIPTIKVARPGQGDGFWTEAPPYLCPASHATAVKERTDASASPARRDPVRGHLDHAGRCGRAADTFDTGHESHSGAAASGRHIGTAQGRATPRPRATAAPL